MKQKDKIWRVGVYYDTSQSGLGGHLTHLAFKGLPRTEIVALVDSNHEGIDERRQLVGAAKHYASLPDMLDSESIDILVVCSRLPGEHAEPLAAAIARGIHVYCEKPLTAGLQEADHIVDEAAQQGIRIAVAHLGRYAQVFQTAKRMIEAGEIGRVLSFYGRGKEDHRGGGEDMLVLGTHILDLACFFFGKPLHVSADITYEGKPIKAGECLETAEPIGPVAGDEVWSAYQFANGVRGWFESRRGMSERGVRMGITIVGTTGTLAVRFDDERKLRLSRSPFPPEDEAQFVDVPMPDDGEIPGADPLECGEYQGFHLYFLRNNRRAAWDLICALEEGREPLSCAQDAQVVLEMIYGAYASQLSGRRIAFPLCERRHPLEIKS
ncbi:Gfo/Idh/MocA family protein [Coraliomargarita parva]|uniref:Gfo/Idh/MocA family protein n=1 Tax=Coraliomargarita parva TaxID=3014050 RepID=UPI0022B59D79|nr:Gfo/Idh/MocA family oxidoreductase [Coraliomargarita parva]